MGNSLPIRRPNSDSPAPKSREQTADDFFLEEEDTSRPNRPQRSVSSNESSESLSPKPTLPLSKKSLPLPSTEESKSSTPRLPASKPAPRAGLRPPSTKSKFPSASAPLADFDITDESLSGANPHHSLSFTDDDDVQLLPSSEAPSLGSQQKPVKPSSKLPFGLKTPSVPKKNTQKTSTPPATGRIPDQSVPDSEPGKQSKRLSIGRKPKGTKIEWINGEPVQVVSPEEEQELKEGVESQLTPHVSAPTRVDTMRFYGRKALVWLQIPLMLFLLSFYALAVKDTPEIVLSFVSPAEIESLFGMGDVLELVVTSQEMSSSVYETHFMTGIAALVALALGWNARRLKNPIILLGLPLLAASIASGLFLTSLLPTLPYYVPVSVLVGGLLMVIVLYLQPTSKIRK